MAQGPSDTILVAIWITLRIRESKVRNPDSPDRRRFVLSECILVVLCLHLGQCSVLSVSLSCPTACLLAFKLFITGQIKMDGRMDVDVQIKSKATLEQRILFSSRH